jgi:hypothetical protein
MIECFPNESTMVPEDSPEATRQKLRPIVVSRGLLFRKEGDHDQTANDPDNSDDESVYNTYDLSSYYADDYSDEEYAYSGDEESDDVDEALPEYRSPRGGRKSKEERSAKNTSQSRTKNVAATSMHPMSPFSHRLERLIHLELSELHHFTGLECPGCRTVHQEWFKIPRKTPSTSSNQPNDTPSGYRSRLTAWPELREVVIRWTRYVDTLAVAEIDDDV